MGGAGRRRDALLFANVGRDAADAAAAACTEIAQRTALAESETGASIDYS